MPPTPANVRARVETDLDDPALQALIDEAVEEITDRYGPYRDDDTPITVTLEGRRRKLALDRPADTITTIVEYFTVSAADVEFADFSDEWVDVGEATTTLATDDWRLWHAGRTLERLFTGTHPRVRWGTRIDITYQPVDDTKQRDEVVVKLTILAVNYDGTIELKVGDVTRVSGLRSKTGGESPLIYADERERLLTSLQPRRGLMFR